MTEHLVTLAGIRADAEGHAGVVDDDRHFGKHARQAGHLKKLVMVHLDVKAQAHSRNTGDAPTKRRVEQHSAGLVAIRANGRCGVPSRGVTDAFESCAALLSVLLKHGGCAVAHGHVDVADDSGDVTARRARAFLRHLPHKDRLAHRPQRLGALGEIVGHAVEIHSAD